MKTFLVILFLVAVSITGARAYERPYGNYGIGPRVGFSSGPDQFRFGGQIDLGDVAPSLMLMPNFDVGVGDNVTTVAMSLDLDYRFRSGADSWTPYIGGGAGPIFYSYDYRSDHSDVGLYFQGGIMRQMSNFNPGRFFMEARFGVVNTPDFALMLGWVFGR